MKDALEIARRVVISSQGISISCPTHIELVLAKALLDTHEKLLELEKEIEDAPVVYGDEKIWNGCSDRRVRNDTHKAKLIRIEEIK